MKLISSIFFIILCMMANGQSAVILDHFQATESNGNVFLNWTFSKGSICNGTEITRSSDSLNFKSVGKIEGICGSNDEAVSYFYEDKQPVLNSTNYYRLEFGAAGTSEIIYIEIVGLNDNGYAVFPNPIKDNGRIYFDNNKGLEHELNIYNINGQLSRKYLSYTNYFDLSSQGFSTGIYLFTIHAENTDPKSGKVVISH